jgi:hypothetical protein
MYTTLVGHVQSGKTLEEMNFCYQNVTIGIPVIFITRNITADQLQLFARFSDFNKTIDTPMEIKILSHGSIEDTVKSMEKSSVIILLCNRMQLRKMKQVLKVYTDEYSLCIDEADFAIKSKDLSSESDALLTQIKSGAKHVLGATATPLALFTNQNDINTIVTLKKNKRYQGIESLNVEFVDPCITTDPRSDTVTINEIYTTLLKKSKAFLLHLVTKKRVQQMKIMHFVSGLFPTFTYIVYNGDGIQVICKNREELPFTKPRSVNKYGQNINKYHMLHKENCVIHFFENYSIAEVLQILVDDFYEHTHISILSGNLASRGVSFVSSDYSLHLTDQYFHPGPKTHGENYMQSLRILGCYNDTLPLTLWCSERTWESINSHNELIHTITNEIKNNVSWLKKIKNVLILKPNSPLTRPRLTVPFRKITHSHFSLDFTDEFYSNEE